MSADLHHPAGLVHRPITLQQMVPLFGAINKDTSGQIFKYVVYRTPRIISLVDCPVHRKGC